MSPWGRLKAIVFAREMRAEKEKLMGHKVKTWIEGLLVATGLGLFEYAASNAALLFDADRKTFYAGLLTTALVTARLYVAARYATPPDVKEKIDEGLFPERRREARIEEAVKDAIAKEEVK